MAPPSLQQLARRACIKNIRFLTTVGEMPYDLVRSILLRVENPEQLREIEENSPHICGRDAELWKEFIKRDIPNGLSKVREADPRDWYDIYTELLAVSQDEAEADARILEATMKGLAEERSKHAVTFVNASSLPKLPGKGVRRQNAATSAAVSGNPAVLSFSAGSKTKTTTGRDVLNRVRKEAREASLFSARKSVLSVPTHRLAGKASQPKIAPVALVQGHKKPTGQIKDATVKARAPERSTNTAKPTSPPSPTAAEKRERRLKALASGKNAFSNPEIKEASKSSKAQRDSSPKQAQPKCHDAAAATTPETTPITSQTTPITSQTTPITSQTTPTTPETTPTTPTELSVSPERRSGGYKALKLSVKPRMMIRKAPVDIFMPVKKRRVV